ncbi:MAG: BatA domain-containing protein [Gilvibacter sp.]
MQFKHPELLYALLLLLIPIIVHLFQLRRFKKEAFTNVAFLKEVVIKTRKSSQVKKWLTLLSRLLAIACIVLAFAQPYFANKKATDNPTRWVLYVDNSFSMQAKGAKGPLLQHTIQDLYAHLGFTDAFDWFTNDQEHLEATLEDFKKEVLQIQPSATQLSLDQVVLKAQNIASNHSDQDVRLLVLSDFQQHDSKEIAISSSIPIDGVYLEAVNRSNISIDSAYVTSSGSKTSLNVLASADNTSQTSFPVSLLNDGQLITKSAFDFTQNTAAELSFELDSNQDVKGQLLINDEQLTFDNSLYFSLAESPRIKVLSVSQESDSYIKRLFSDAEFELTSYRLSDLNFSEILDQQLLILNGLNEITTPLLGAITPFVQNGGHLLIIPGVSIDVDSYNVLSQQLNVGRWGTLINQERNIATIRFDHPIYKDVFDKNVTNFEYPKVNRFYSFTNPTTAALLLDGGDPFLVQKDNITLFTASLSGENSNFINSPLIVPTLYNIAKNSLPSPTLYYTIGIENQIAIPVVTEQDEVIRLRDAQDFIPLQQRFSQQVRITTTDQPELAANYYVMASTDTLGLLSYNYSRLENRNQYTPISQLEAVNFYDSTTELLTKIREDSSVTTYWKWFIIFAVLFLLLEMAFLKFLK